MATLNKSNYSSELEDLSKHSPSMNSDSSSASDDSVQSKKVSGTNKKTTKKKTKTNQMQRQVICHLQTHKLRLPAQTIHETSNATVKKRTKF